LKQICLSPGDDSGENSTDLSEHEEKVIEADAALNIQNSSNILMLILVFP
jgi:hypothetical protein